MFEDAILWQCIVLQQQCVLTMQQIMNQIQADYARQWAMEQDHKAATDLGNYLISQQQG